MSAQSQWIGTFFDTHPVFRVEEFVEFHAGQGGRSPATSATVLKQRCAAGGLLHLRRGLYAVVPRGVPPERVQVDPFLIAARHTPDAVVAFHGALQFHGRAYSDWTRVHVWTTLRSRPFTWRGVEVVPVQVPVELRATPDWGGGVLERAHAGAMVRVTSLERALVDVLDKLDKGGGIEEIWRSLEMIEFVDSEEVVQYVLQLGRALTVARVGFFLEHHQAQWFIEDSVLSALRARRPGEPTYFDGSRQPGVLNRGWNLIVPEQIQKRAWEELA